LEAQKGLQEQQGGKQKNTIMQHLLDQPKEVEAEKVQWEIEEANEAMRMKCCDEMGAVLDGQVTDAQEGELETSSVQAQKALAAIPEASTPSRRSKRRVSTIDQSSLEQEERIKAALNLDSTPKLGNRQASHNSFLQFSNDQIVFNLSVVGISLGNNSEFVSSSVACVKEMELNRLQQVFDVDKISSIFYKEEKEEKEREEVDNLILSSLCNEIVEKVMDLGNAYLMDCNVTPKHKPSPSTKIGKTSRSKSKNKCSK
jgi:hypothetical protein